MPQTHTFISKRASCKIRNMQLVHETMTQIQIMSIVTFKRGSTCEPLNTVMSFISSQWFPTNKNKLSYTTSQFLSLDGNFFAS